MTLLIAKADEVVLPPVRATHHAWLGGLILVAWCAGVFIASAVVVLMALRFRRKPRDEQ
jgi:hypothetical protein